MSEDITAFKQSLDEMSRGVTQARDHIAEVPRAANDLLASLPVSPSVRELIVWSAQQVVEVATHLLDLIEQALDGAAAPIWFVDYALHWQDVRGTASGAAAALTPVLMPSSAAWHGQAATAYTRAMAPQHDAAAKIATISDKTSTALNWCAAAGITFYVVVAIIVVKLVIALVAAIAAFGSAVFSPAGAALVVEEALTNTGLLITAASALATALTAQALQLGTLHGEAVDNTTFPAGHWPNPVTSSYDDGTVTDNDADWSLRP